ncbi:hypothetical protein [Dapis sp. BLCC M172]|uniref:hypothetical protein n=1 Tax=Dapis sp. BLCC M172 TaxID=2975281 RepID=UPI003CE8B758
MGFKAHKIKPYGKPDLANANQLSNPKSDREKVQALADSLEFMVKGKILKEYGNRTLLISDMQYSQGTDGNDGKTYSREIGNDFQGTAINSKNQQPLNKETAPDLKKVSEEKAVEVQIPGTGGAKTSKKNSKK